MKRSLQAARTLVHNSVVLRSAFWYTVGLATSRGLAFVTITIYALLLTPEQLGTTTIFLTIGRLFLIVSSLNLFEVPVRARADYDDKGYRGFVSAITVLGIGVSTILAIVVSLVPDAWLLAVFQLPKLWIVAAAVSTPLTLPMFIMLSVLQAESKANVYTRIVIALEVLTAVASVAFIIIPLGFDPSFDRAAGRIAGVLIVRSVIGMVLIRHLLNGRFYNPADWRYALLYAIPIMPHAIASEMLANYDRVMIAQFYSETETGIYSVAYQFGSMITLLAITTAAAWGPWFYRTMASRHFALVRKRTNQFVLIFTLLTIVTIIVIPPLVRLIIPPQYWDALPLIPVIMISGHFFFLHYFFAFIEANDKRTIYTSIATLCAAGVNILLNSILFTYLDYTIAAWTTVASYACLFGIHAGVVRFILKSDTVNNLALMLGSSVAVFASALIVWRVWLGVAA